MFSGTYANFDSPEFSNEALKSSISTKSPLPIKIVTMSKGLLSKTRFSGNLKTVNE